MFGLFGGKKKKLEKEYSRLLEKGMLAQRNGKMAEFAEFSHQAQEIYKEIQEIEAQSKKED